jgi:hypothetical protein
MSAKPALVPALVADGATTAETPALNPAIKYVEGLGYLIGSGATIKGFTTYDAAAKYLAENEVGMLVEAFYAHVVANPADYFVVKGKKGRTKKDGTVTADTPDRVLEGKMQDAAMTRLLRAARKIYEFEASRGLA